MLKKVVDSSIFIDRLHDPARHREVFASDGVVYFSSVVLMELRAGAHDIDAIRAIDDLSGYFRRVGRILTPTALDYERAGKALADLQRLKGYTIGKSASITNDCLIAASARSIGAVVCTGNRKDFAAISDVLDYEVSYV